MKRKFSISVFLTLLALGALSAAAQIKGVLLKSNGKPLAYTEIELVPVLSHKIVNDARLVATTGTNGRFAFGEIPPGRYTLSINFDDKPTELSPYDTFFYPTATAREDAEIFEIGAAAKTQNITFRLPPALVRAKIAGKIVDRDEKAVEGAWLALRDVAFDRGMVSFGAVKTDRNGNFTINAFANRQYQVGALLLLNKELTIFDTPEILGAAESEIFTLDAAKPIALKLILRERKDYDRLRDKYVGETRQNGRDVSDLKIKIVHKRSFLR